MEGRLDESAALLREASEIAAENTGGDRSLEAGLKVEWARLHLLHHEPSADVPLLRDALANLRQSYPEHGWRIGSIKSLLGEALTEVGSYAEAEALLRDAASDLPDRAGPCGREKQPNRDRLARLEVARAAATAAVTK